MEEADVGKKVGEEGDYNIVEYTQSDLMKLSLADLVQRCSDNEVPIDQVKRALVRLLFKAGKP